MEPIIAYGSQEELEASLAEWQERLFLQDWIITAAVVRSSEMDECSNGQVTQYTVKAAAMISLLHPDDYPCDSLEKQCHEKTLVHELLHCRLDWVSAKMDTMESAMWAAVQHKNIEQLARSLIMAKYGITFDWFQND